MRNNPIKIAEILKEEGSQEARTALLSLNIRENSTKDRINPGMEKTLTKLAELCSDVSRAVVMN